MRSASSRAGASSAGSRRFGPPCRRIRQAEFQRQRVARPRAVLFQAPASPPPRKPRRHARTTRGHGQPRLLAPRSGRAQVASVAVASGLTNRPSLFTVCSHMSEPATVSALAGQGDEPAPAGAGDDGRGLTQRQLAVLGRLAEAGLNVALAVERQALAAEAASPEAVQAPLPDLALAYGRVSRAVRLTIALQARLLTELQARDEVAARIERGTLANAERDAKLAAAARRARVRRIVERVVWAE